MFLLQVPLFPQRVLYVFAKVLGYAGALPPAEPQEVGQEKGDALESWVPVSEEWLEDSPSLAQDASPPLSLVPYAALLLACHQVFPQMVLDVSSV